MKYAREMSEPSKRRILIALSHGGKTVNEIVAETGLKQPNVSNHLAKLRDRGAVAYERQGRTVTYSLANAEVHDAVTRALKLNPDSTPAVVLNKGTIEKFCQLAIISDESETNGVIDSLLAHGKDVVTIYTQLITPAMVQIGEWWHRGVIDISQEHIATAHIERTMARVMLGAPPLHESPWVVLVGCTEGNIHTIGTRMVADVFRWMKWKPYYLGANVPHNSFIQAVKDHRPHVIATTCPRIENLRSVRGFLSALSTSGVQGQSVLLGGQYAVDHPDEFQEFASVQLVSNLNDLAHSVIPEIESTLSAANPAS